ncbi:hypothetical protein L9F63_025606, partial [Diploptera punctata]
TNCPLASKKKKALKHEWMCKIENRSLPGVAMVMVIALIVVIIFLVCLDVIKPRGYPPGPVWLPVVGSYLWFRREKSRVGYYHLVWSSLSSRYGPVTGMRLGTDYIVVACGYDAIRDILLRDEFDGRPDGYFFRLRTFGKRMGVVFTDGPVWQEQRRFCMQHLRKLGLGSRSMEAHIEERSEGSSSLTTQKK